MILLVEGVGGDIRPYMEHLQREKISTRPEATTVILQQETKQRADFELDKIIVEIGKNYF